MLYALARMDLHGSAAAILSYLLSSLSSLKISCS